MVWHSPGDLYFWWVNVFAGSMTMFLAIAFLVIAILAGMFRMPTLIVGVMFGLFIIMLSAYTGTLVLVVLLIAGISIGWIIARFFR